MIYLLDLNYTLVSNSHTKIKPFEKQIAQEEYRDWLVDLLRPHYVILMTARPEKYTESTLNHIIAETGWRPQEAYFNTGGTPPDTKRRAFLEHVKPRHGDGPYFALESNPLTRRMYEAIGIKAVPVPADGARWEALPR